MPWTLSFMKDDYRILDYIHHWNGSDQCCSHGERGRALCDKLVKYRKAQGLLWGEIRPLILNLGCNTHADLNDNYYLISHMLAMLHQVLQDLHKRHLVNRSSSPPDEKLCEKCVKWSPWVTSGLQTRFNWNPSSPLGVMLVHLIFFSRFDWVLR